MKRIGEDVSEKLDYMPGLFIVERDTRGKVGCRAYPPHKFDEPRMSQKSLTALEATTSFGSIYDIERAAKHLEAEER